MHLFLEYFVFPLAIVAICGCSDTIVRDVGHTTLEATFSVEGETFKVRVTNPATIDVLVDVWKRTSAATIPNGVLREGPGEDDYNLPWSWHLDAQDVEMAEVTIEVCSGKPSDVEADLEYWIQTVGRFCPWSAELTSLIAL